MLKGHWEHSGMPNFKYSAPCDDYEKISYTVKDAEQTLGQASHISKLIYTILI